ncbi:hypothetical protein EIM50_20810, partial [Pseudoxanthomonas sp. SGD-10]
MRIFLNNIFYGLFLAVLGLASCQDKWAEHNELKDPQLQKTLYDVISEDGQFSKFHDLLKNTGLDKELKASKNYTLILPTNTAVEQASQVMDFNNAEVVSNYVSYHILNSAYTLRPQSDTLRVKSIYTKYVNFLDGKINGVTPVLANNVVANGIYHIISQPILPKENIYEFMTNSYRNSKQGQAISAFDTVYVENDSLIYKSSPAWVSEVKRYMTNERQQFTYFILEDNYFDEQYNTLSPYYSTDYDQNGPRPDSTTVFFTQKAMLADLIVPGYYTLDNLSDSLESVSGLKFKVDASKIVETFELSNAVVYKVSSLPVQLKDQIREFKILGNLPSGFRQNDKSGNIYYRNKIDNSGNLYNDIQVFGHGVSQFYIKYNRRATPSVKYKVYGRGIIGLQGDPQNGVAAPYNTLVKQYVAFWK